MATTHLWYAGASRGIAATLSAGGAGSVAGGRLGGTDTILGGVNSIVGTNFDDTITLNSPGSAFQSSFSGGGGSDNFVFKATAAMRPLLTSMRTPEVRRIRSI